MARQTRKYNPRMSGGVSPDDPYYQGGQQGTDYPGAEKPLLPVPS